MKNKVFRGKFPKRTFKQSRVFKADTTEGGILATLWNSIITETKLIGNLSYYLKIYTNAGGKRSPSTISGYFKDNSMTWKTFVFLCLKILPVVKMKLTVELTFKDKSVYPFSIDVYSKDVANDESEELEVKGVKNDKDK